MALATTARAQFPQADADAKYATELLKADAQAPDFKMKTLEGKTFKFAKQTKGKYVVLDFWASWCPDCRKDIPNIQRMYEKFAPLGVEFIGVSMDTDRDKWKAAVEQYGIKYTQVSELVKFHDTQIAALYGVKWIPSMYLISPEGKVLLSTVLSDKLECMLTETFAPQGQIYGTQERVSIDGAKGKLAAIIQKPELKQGERCPMVVLCHGFGGRKDGDMFELIADSLAHHGIASVRFDFNAHGESEGKFEEMTVPNEIEDAKHVVDYVRDLRYVSNISLVGHSQGGVVAAMTAGELGSEDVAAVALMAPAAVLRDDAIRGSTFGKSYDPLDPPEFVQLFGNQKLGREYIKTAFRLPIYETAARYHGPALVVHGTGDRVVPYTYGERFHQQWPGSEYVELEAFDHGFTQNIYRTCDIVSSWLIKTLKR
ncbi:MAG: alpha/beta fold hydrolase [Prevotella sp.]|nr:alpha/beta fold hydrolase [Prevotella sp.]